MNNEAATRRRSGAKPAFILCLCVLPLLGLVLSCSPGLERIDASTRSNLRLDSGTGYRPYDGGLLPESLDPSVQTWRFALDLQLAEPLRSPALIVGPSAFPYTLYLNGQLVHRHGTFADQNRTRLFPSSLVYLDPSQLSESNLLEVEAYISVERTPLMDLALSEAEQASAYVYWRNFFMTQLVTSGFAIGLLLLVYFLFMFLVGKRRNYNYLWFALFCATFALAYTNIVFNHYAASDTFLTKLSRVGFFMSVTFFSWYVMEATGILARRRYIKPAMMGLVLICSVLVVVQRDFNGTNRMFHLVMQFIITPNLVFSIVLIIIAVLKGGIQRYFILCVGFLGVIVTSLYDMRYETGQLIPYAWTLVYGYEWLVICVFLELAVKQELVFRTSKRQAAAIERKNDALQRVFGLLRQESDLLSASSEEIAVSTREVSVTGNQQAAAVREIVATMENAGELLGNIASQTGKVSEDSSRTAQKAQEGAENAMEALSKLEVVTGNIAESISLINDFSEQLGSITEIVKLIEGIATQIRIIAFNASLEAVAAGEAGRNFRIVAEEVKRLADSTMSSVKNIRGKVSSLLGASDRVVKAAQDGHDSLERSWAIASGMGSAFDGILESAESSAGASSLIDQSIREQNQAFQQILQALKEISSGVNSFVESANYTSETTKRLNEIAEHLHGLIADHADAVDGG